jgi:FK506-binding protein 1
VERNLPINFKLGIGNVIKGFDEFIPKMNKGATAILTCSPSYAYGK